MIHTLVMGAAAQAAQTATPAGIDGGTGTVIGACVIAWALWHWAGHGGGGHGGGHGRRHGSGGHGRRGHGRGGRR